MLLASRTAAWEKAGGPTPPAYGGLCFTAEVQGSTVALEKVGTPYDISLVISRDGINWVDYSIDTVVELNSVGDSVYFAAGDGGNQLFTKSGKNRYSFRCTGEVSSSGDIISLLDYNLTKGIVLPEYCFRSLFITKNLISSPFLSPEVLYSGCFNRLFQSARSLRSIVANFTNWSKETELWVYDVSKEGVFYKRHELPEEYGTDKIPTGWTVVNID